MRLNSAFAGIAATFMTASLVACGGGSTTPGNGAAQQSIGRCVLPDGPLAVAISRRANSPGTVPVQVTEMVEKFIEKIPAGVTGPTLTLINVDGRPGVQQSGPFRSPAGNSIRLKNDQLNFLKGFQRAASDMRAEEAEVDVLSALEQAGGAAGRPKAGTVVLVDSGLTTSGALDFSQPGVLDAPADDMIPFLRNTGALPDLHGLTVVLMGIGDVARPQETLGTRKTHLVELWTKIAEASGAACVTSVEAPRRGDPVGGPLKPVKLVAIPRPPAYQPGGITVLPDAGEVGFEPGTAVFRDPEAARKVLQPIADQLKADRSVQLRLTGTTARWGPKNKQIDLARQRAETVKQELIGLGADPSQIAEPRGLGSYFAQYVPDNGPDGVLLPGPAQANRTVRIEPCHLSCPSDPPTTPS